MKELVEATVKLARNELGESYQRDEDMLGFLISHPCLTFDRRRSFPLVDDADRQVGTVSNAF